MDIKRAATRWQDCASLAIGVWLLISPWVINYTNDNPALWSTSTYIAAAIIGIALFSIFLPNIVCEGLLFTIGVCLITSPWILSHDVNALDQRLRQIMMVDSVLISVLLLVFSLWVMFDDGRIQKWLTKAG